MQWPGYPPRSLTINIKTFERDPRPITKLNLGRKVAQTLATIMNVSHAFYVGTLEPRFL